MKKFLLKQKVALSLTIISFISLLIVGVIVFTYINKILITNKETEILYVVQEQARESILTFRINQLFVHMLSADTQVKDFLLDHGESKKAELLNIFLEHTNKEKKYLAIYLLDKNGIGLISTDLRFVGEDYSSRDYFKKAATGEPTISVAIDKTSNQLGYYFAEPVFGNMSDVIGVMVAKVDPSDINNPIISNVVSKDNVLALTDEFGVILYSSEADRNFKSLGVLSNQEKSKLQENDRFLGQKIVPLQYDLLQQGIREYKGPIFVNIYDNVDKDTETLSLIKLNELPFYFVTEIRLESVNNQVFNIAIIITSIFLIILIIISLFIYYAITIFLKPLDKFKLFFDNISKGDFSQEIKIKTKDELSDLAAGVNKMLKELTGLYYHLDEKVKEKTEKLNEKISQLDESNNNLIDSKKAIVNLIQDIEDEKKQIEENVKLKTRELSIEKSRLASSIDSLSFGFIIISTNGTIILTNPALLKILNIVEAPKKIDELVKLFKDFDLLNSYRECVDTQETLEISEISFVNKFLKLSFAPVVNINKIIDYVILFEDITEAKVIERSREEFFAVASHELRTPLTAIRGNADMILDMYSDQIPNTDIKEMLKDINLASVRLIDIVNNFLEVSRLEQGKVTIKPEKFELPKIIKKVVKNIEGIARKKNISITYNLPETDLPEVFADKSSTEQVLINIISNAVKFTNSGSVFITTEVDGHFMKVRVADTGIGIKNENQSLLFRKFQQANDKVLIRTDSNSTGLGLYISKLLLLAMGGDIYLEKSVPGTGSIFVFTLPFVM